MGEYRRMTMLGADCSLPLGRFVLRGEVAEYLDEAQNQFSILNSQFVRHQRPAPRTLGYDFFHADRGSFTVYDNNSEVFVKLKYSF